MPPRPISTARSSCPAAPKGASVLILGAGIAGMVAAYELRDAGYKVQVLEYNDRPGGRNWSLYGGDTYTELGGVTQQVQFDQGLYFNPGPWRIPYHHQGILHYCQRARTWRSSPSSRSTTTPMSIRPEAFGGKPKRYREVAGRLPRPCRRAAGQGHQPGRARQASSTRTRRTACCRRCATGARWTRITNTRRATLASNVRGFDVDPGGGLNSVPVDSEPMPRKELFKSHACGCRDSPAKNHEISRARSSSPWAAWA